MTCWTRRERWTASGSILRTVAAARRGIQLLPLDAVLRAGLLAVADARGVERPAHDLVAHARQVLDAAAAHEHHGVLLQVVALAGDVRRDLHAVGEPDAGDLAQSRVRLLRRHGVDARAHAPALGRGHLGLAAATGLQAGRGELAAGGLATLADELGGRGHAACKGSSGLMFRRSPPFALVLVVSFLIVAGIAVLVAQGGEDSPPPPAASLTPDIVRRCLTSTATA